MKLHQKWKNEIKKESFYELNFHTVFFLILNIIFSRLAVSATQYERMQKLPLPRYFP